MTLAPAEPRTFREQAGAKPTPEAGLLSGEATAAVGSAFNTLTETCLCRARHKAVYAARRTMPSGPVFPNIYRDLHVGDSA